IGLLGAKIWKENRVDFGNPLNLVPVAAGVVIAIGDTTLTITDDFQLGGIALGTLVVILGYHLGRAIAPQLRAQAARDEVHELTLLGPTPDITALERRPDDE
ncbi:MAG: nitrate reductase, partial [Dietzia sp.]